jgi:hypothetical protein
MARFTSLEFLEALGLSYGDYNGAKILLRLLQKKGIAKEVDKISPTGRGRKMVVYELPDEIKFGVKPPEFIPSHPIRKKKEESEVTVTSPVVVENKIEECEPVEVIGDEIEVCEPVAVNTEFEWDDGWEDD